jgi:hypothetical protein
MLVLLVIISALPSKRCRPLVPGLQPQAETRIVDAQIPVRVALNRLGHDLGDLLRHDPDMDRVSVAENAHAVPDVASARTRRRRRRTGGSSVAPATAMILLRRHHHNP